MYLRKAGLPICADGTDGRLRIVARLTLRITEPDNYSFCPKTLLHIGNILRFGLMLC